MTYEEAHRYADTIFPRHLWELAETDLVPIRSICTRLAEELGAGVRFNLSVKHPHPGCIVVKRVGRVEVAVELWAEPSDDGLVYRLGVKRAPLRTFLRLSSVPTWEPTAIYSRSEVQRGEQDFVREVEETIGRAFGAD